MNKRFILLLSIIMVFSVLLAACSTGGDEQAADNNKGAMLQKVKDRGKLIAGVNGKLPGFGYLESDGTYTGFDVDIARAIAAAVFGDPNKIEFRPLSAQERFTAVQTGEVDVLIRNTTWTSSRDADIGMNFAPVTFYDGQGIMVKKASGIKTLEDLEGARIAVESGTTTELNLADQFRKYGINYEPVVFDSADSAIAAYEQGSVDAYTTDRSGLVSRRATMANPADHVILEAVLSKEPLAPAVLDGDDEWYDVVKWVVYGLLLAEEAGITQANIDEALKSDDPNIRRLLGVEGELGSQLGLPNDFVVNMIRAVGNYGEIYSRHLGPGTIFELDRGLNELYINGGIQYAPPMR